MLLVKKRNFKVFVTIAIISSRMHPVVCFFNIDAEPNLVRASLFGTEYLDCIRQRNMLKFQCSHDINRKSLKQMHFRFVLLNIANASNLGL